MSSIAIYETDDLMCGLLREWLSGAGYAVRDGVRPHDPVAPAELAIVSVSMPKHESEALIRSVRRVHPKSAIIALSSCARSGLSSNGAAARELGVERVMAKPLTRNELLSAVESIVGPASRAPQVC